MPTPALPFQSLNLVGLFTRTPLAWHNLTADRRRLLTALAGVSFAVVLIFVFLGFKNGLYDSQVQLLKALNGDVFIISRLKSAMFIPEKFPRQRLYQAQSFEGVEAAYPLYILNSTWKNPDTKVLRSLRILAFNPQDPVLPLPEILAHQADLQKPWTVMMDDQVRAEVGRREPGLVTELASKRVTLLGTFHLGTDFAGGDGNLVMGDQNFLRYFSNQSLENVLGNQGDNASQRGLDLVDIGILKVRSGSDVEAIVRSLQGALPEDVWVFTRQGFIERELSYWRDNTNIGFVFSLLSSLSFVVGVILVYQILYTDVAEHWAEYATLKAIGYTNGQLLGVVIQQALILSIIGFIPGWLISSGLYRLIQGSTGLVLELTTQRVSNILIATIAMCLISATIALRKVFDTDPAEVFGL